MLWYLFHFQLLLYRRFTRIRVYLSPPSAACTPLSVAGLLWRGLFATVSYRPLVRVLHLSLRMRSLLPRLGCLYHRPALTRLDLLPLLPPPSSSYHLPLWILSYILRLCSCWNWSI